MQKPGVRSFASVALLAAVFTSAAGAQQLPFTIGEKLSYRVSVSKLGNVGSGSMWVEGPVDIRGVSTWLLRFDFQAGMGPMKAIDRTSSWLDPVRMAAQRYTKLEKHVLAKRDERVEIFASQKKWAGSDGASGVSPTDTPLDELSFMYFVRTLPLEADSTYRFNRHFDPARSPTTVAVIRREAISTPAGKFNTVLVEMRVRDSRRYKGEGVIRINLSDDAMRIPVRIESAMPVVGTAVMTLESFNNPLAAKLAKL
ncbi:MAG TPA: DUF3108 domain-containing protein [Gemmatimonadaceae bacterium]|jgi:hypothetical protein|nr:DUF3108 domain-containing protein [Gemmatimonadaceae bacterium]